jgi:hypothetical protein
MGSRERRDAILLGLGRRKEAGQPLIISSVEFQVHVSKMNVEERIRLVGSIEGRGEEGMRFGRWFACSNWWERQQGRDHGRLEAVPWLLKWNLLEVEEEVLGRVGQKGVLGWLQKLILNWFKDFEFKKSRDLNTFKLNLN